MIGLRNLKPNDRIEVTYAPGRMPTPLAECVWLFDVACLNGGSHLIKVLKTPIQCETCGVEAVERERKAPG